MHQRNYLEEFIIFALKFNGHTTESSLRRQRKMLHSTNNRSLKVSLTQSLVGYMPDGGLCVPDSLPRIPQAFFNNIAEMSLQEIAFVVLKMFLCDIFSPETIKKIVNEVFSAEIPVKWDSKNCFTIEIFKNISKNIGGHFLSALIAHLKEGENTGYNIITVVDHNGADTITGDCITRSNQCVLFPSGELSSEQIAQIVTSNISAIEIDGTLYDCQSLVKHFLMSANNRSDKVWISGNSISFVRGLPYIVCCFHAYARAMETETIGEDTAIVMLASDLESLYTSLIAKKLGLPISKVYVTPAVCNSLSLHGQVSGMTIGAIENLWDSGCVAKINDLYCGDLKKLQNDIECYYSDIGSPDFEKYRSIHDSTNITQVAAETKSVKIMITNDVPNAVKESHAYSDERCSNQNIGHHRKIIKIPPSLSALMRVLNI